MSRAHISSLHIEYANLQPVNIEQFSPAINVIYGQNETGKTRIREFITWMLFASDPKYLTEKTGKINSAYKNAFKNIDELTKGEIEISAKGNLSKIFQQIDNSKLINRITPSNVDLRQDLTDSISLENYNSIYSLSLDQINEIQSKNLLEDNTHLEYIFGALKANTTISPALLIKTLKDKCDVLFAESSTAKKSINANLKQIDEIKKQLKTLKTESKETNLIEQQLSELLGEKDTKLKQLEYLRAKIDDIQTKLQGVEIYSNYLRLKSESTKNFNEKLVGEINEIDVLQRESVRLLNLENEQHVIESQKTQIQDKIEKLEIRLEETLNAKQATSYLLSHEFETILEDEIDRKAYAKNKNESLMTELERSKSQLALLTKKLQQDETSSDKNTKEVFEESNKSNTNIFFLIGFILFGALGALGFVLDSGAISAVGITASIASIFSYFYLKKILGENKTANIDESKSSQTIIELEHTKEELHNKEQQLASFNKESENNQAAYVNACIKAGFVEPIDAKHAQKYIKDYNDLQNKQNELGKIEAEISKTITVIDNFYETLNDLAQKVSYSDHTKFTSIAHAQNWLQTFNEYAKSEKQKADHYDKILKQLENLETQLSEKFVNLDECKEIFKDTNKEQLNIELQEMTDEFNISKTKYDEINKSIGSIEEKQKYLNRSTQIQDLILEQEELLTSLRHYDEQYKLAFSAYKICENAFNKWRENYQPEVTIIASKYFNQITKEKWSALQIDSLVDPSVKNQGELFRARNSDTILESSKLSRGTSEQLYLAFRLAIMQTNKKAACVPVMFDDISVNFDRERFTALLPIIDEISTNRQVFYFTCHENVRDGLASHANTKIINL